MLNVYDGTLGVLSNIDNVITKLKEYQVRSNDRLNYEYIEDKIGIVIITGKNEHEKEIDMFAHPVIYEDVKGRTNVAVDIRAYMKSNLDDLVFINDKLQDKYNGMLQLYRLVFTVNMLENDVGALKYLNQSLMESFATIISGVTSIMLYDKSIKPAVDIMSKMHYISMDMDKEKVSINDLVDYLPPKETRMLMNGDLADLYRHLLLMENQSKIVLPSRSIGALINNIKASISTGRGDGLDLDLYTQAMSRGFYSMDSKNLAIAMIENKPTFYAVLIAVMREGINSSSSFRKMLDANKRLTKAKETAQKLFEVYEERISK